MLIVSWNWVWNFIQKIPPWEIWHITLAIPSQILSILCLFLAEISIKFRSKKTLLRNKTHNTSIPNPIFSKFLAEKYQILFKRYLLEKYAIPNQNQFCAYFWLKLVWNFIQRIPPWDIWLVTLQFKIIISWVFAYC